MLKIDKGTLEPAFTPRNNLYMVSVPYTVTSIAINAEAYSSKSVITDGIGTHQLYVGNNKIDVVVKAENDELNKYTIIVDRGEGEGADTNNTLLSLSCSGITLSPVFEKETMIYQATVDYSVKATTISAIKESTKAVIDNSQLGMNAIVTGKQIGRAHV